MPPPLSKGCPFDVSSYWRTSVVAPRSVSRRATPAEDRVGDTLVPGEMRRRLRQKGALVHLSAHARCDLGVLRGSLRTEGSQVCP